MPLVFHLVLEGKYGDRAKLFGCMDCDPGLTSAEGSRSCLLARKDYYLPSLTFDLSEKAMRNTTTATKCPEFAICNGADFAPIPAKGFW